MFITYYQMHSFVFEVTHVGEAVSVYPQLTYPILLNGFRLNLVLHIYAKLVAQIEFRFI
jgi:hypothetical protein